MDGTTRARYVKMCWRHSHSACEYGRFPTLTNTLDADSSSPGKGERRGLIESIVADQAHGCPVHLVDGPVHEYLLSSWTPQPVTTTSTTKSGPSSETSEGQASLVRCPTILQDYTPVSGLCDTQHCSSHVQDARRLCISRPAGIAQPQRCDQALRGQTSSSSCHTWAVCPDTTLYINHHAGPRTPHPRQPRAPLRRVGRRYEPHPPAESALATPCKVSIVCRSPYILTHTRIHIRKPHARTHSVLYHTQPGD